MKIHSVECETSMATASVSASEQLSPFPVHRFTVAEYHRLNENGFLKPEDRVELLEGWIVRKMNLSPPHSVTVQTTSDLIREALPEGWCIRTQDAVATDDSEPEPDVAVVRGRHRDYPNAHPQASQTALIVPPHHSNNDKALTGRGRLQAQGELQSSKGNLIAVIQLSGNIVTYPAAVHESPVQAIAISDDEDALFNRQERVLGGHLPKMALIALIRIQQTQG
jgi:hypothetical protein